MKKLIPGLLLSFILAAPALAQSLAPPPRSAPRTPVNREDHTRSTPREVEGQALIIDGEKLRIGDVDLRLFGIVPPQLSASFGPQARATLDAVMGGGKTVACRVRDRDHDGRLLATCVGPDGSDPALEMLRRGLAVAARGSITDTELAQPYLAAEQAAQNDKAGLWSITAISSAPVSAPAPVAAAPKIVDAGKSVMVPVKANDKPVAAAPAVVTPAVAVKADAVPYESIGFFTRYQILIACGLMLATALSILTVLTLHRRNEKRDEMKALAAALRGELLAARAVCLTRVKSIHSEVDDRAASWPRIRATLYQAYVGKIGWLGAELARHIASIYGQSSDYASYYAHLTDDNAVPPGMPKRQALQTLASHIDDVLPRLAAIEQTGHRVPAPVYAANPYPPSYAAPAPQPPMTEQAAEPAPVMAITSMLPTPMQAETPASENAAEAQPPRVDSKLRDLARHLRERFADTRQARVELPEETMGDYTSIIEEEVERFSFGGEEEDETPSLGKTANP